jgi:hypothetical protein
MALPKPTRGAQYFLLKVEREKLCTAAPGPSLIFFTSAQQSQAQYYF